ncbi:hypothetical protein [Rhizobium lentis]|uniref:Uncharacterized protein n=1 Tax=Rhizobium lentis TaxID=1138194 RepID=A0A9Q3QXJ9_9HYPH|nr:hypothetical protein [Rhizobium lentis]MBX5023045.1 hypothetical protein [Rhizobium lentis]MBX5048107.1 hypothetical protein [Rhizobium lentis]MBX5059624.1 hypothetical protein [Rhizobium lentis]
MSKPDSLRLSPRRLEQLHAIANALDLSVTEAVTHLIRREIAAGTIPAAIPGFNVHRVADGILIQIDDGPSKTYSVESARALASTLRGTVAGEAGVFSVQHGYSFIRLGRGFKLTAPMPGPEVSMTGDLAIDLAEQIEKAAE